MPQKALMMHTFCGAARMMNWCPRSLMAISWSRGFNRSTQHLLILLDWEVAMEGNARTWFTPKQRAELWERWKSGQCVADIARALERRNKSGVYRVLAIDGGIAPSPRR